MMMKCGHKAQGTLEKTGKPVCMICYPHPNATIEEDDMPNLEDRMAKCSDCGNTKPSIEWESLAFFEYQSKYANDSYYCGCYGWD